MSTVSNELFSTFDKEKLFFFLASGGIMLEHKPEKTRKIYEQIADQFIELDASSPLEKREIEELKGFCEKDLFAHIVLSRVGSHKIRQLNTDELIDLLGSGELMKGSDIFPSFWVRLIVYNEFIKKERSKELTEIHIQKLSEYLEHKECDVRRRAVELLYNIPENYVADEKLIQRCIALLRDKNGFVTKGAANVFTRGMKNQCLKKRHIEPIVENLSDSDFVVRMAACYFFKQIASIFPEDSHLFEQVTMKLGKLLKDQWINVILAARPALEEIWKEQGDRYVKLIDRHMKSLEKLDYSEGYLCSIAENQRLNESHIKRLKVLLDHPEYWVQAKAVNILGKVAFKQENNEELFQALIEKLQSEEKLVRKSARNSLFRMNEKLTYKQIEQICGCLKSRNAAERRTVEELINWLRCRGWSFSIVEILKKLKETSESEIVQNINILKRITKV